MTRVIETEVMSEQQQALEYAHAATKDASLAMRLISYVRDNPTEHVTSIADLGAGPCGYHAGLYKLYPEAVITAYEASAAMIELAAQFTNPDKTILVHKNIRALSECPVGHDVVMSSLVLHQMSEPDDFWRAVKAAGKPGARFIVFDLIHIPDESTAQSVVDSWTPSPAFGDVFRKDFKNSLRAAFTLQQVENQLADAKITASVTTLSVWPGVSVFFADGTLPTEHA
jgi:trans-aconitate methyltransferase